MKTLAVSRSLEGISGARAIPELIGQRFVGDVGVYLPRPPAEIKQKITPKLERPT